MYGASYISCGIALDIITRQVLVQLTCQVSLHVFVIFIVFPFEDWHLSRGSNSPLFDYNDALFRGDWAEASPQPWDSSESGQRRTQAFAKQNVSWTPSNTTQYILIKLAKTYLAHLRQVTDVGVGINDTRQYRRLEMSA